MAEETAGLRAFFALIKGIRRLTIRHDLKHQSCPTGKSHKEIKNRCICCSGFLYNKGDA